MATLRHHEIHSHAKSHLAKQENRNPEEEKRILQWIENVVHEAPSGDFEHYIQDGSVLSKLMVSLVFNSVPKEVITANWGSKPALERVRALIFEMKRYGVKDVFEPEDLLEMKNIPKVTRCLQDLAKLAWVRKDIIQPLSEQSQQDVALTS